MPAIWNGRQHVLGGCEEFFMCHSVMKFQIKLIQRAGEKDIENARERTHSYGWDKWFVGTNDRKSQPRNDLNP